MKQSPCCYGYKAADMLEADVSICLTCCIGCVLHLLPGTLLMELLQTPQQDSTISVTSRTHLLLCQLQGTLLVDPSAPSLELSAHYILLRGGTLRAGSSITQPHPGLFTITLWGDKETARRLPTFGAKVRCRSSYYSSIAATSACVYFVMCVSAASRSHTRALHYRALGRQGDRTASANIRSKGAF
jgi:hypothetical protein